LPRKLSGARLLIAKWAAVMTVDPYAVLGVAPTATQAEITHAYRRHLRDHHPDLRSPEPNAPADERLREILAAYALLRDPTRRAAYDRAHPRHRDAGARRIDVRHGEPPDDQPDLWAGPVRWQR
jgi:curved DNA-binding protein CbpA